MKSVDNVALLNDVIAEMSISQRVEQKLIFWVLRAAYHNYKVSYYYSPNLSARLVYEVCVIFML